MVNKLTTYLSIGNCYLFYYRKRRQEVGADLTMPLPFPAPCMS